MELQVVTRSTETALRTEADALHDFVLNVRPEFVGQEVIDAANARLSVIYGQINPPTFGPY